MQTLFCSRPELTWTWMKLTESQRIYWEICALQVAVYKMLSNGLTLLNNIILEKLIGPHLDKKFLHLTWTLMVHYCVHKSLLLVPALCQMHPVCVFTYFHLCWHLPNAVFPTGFPTKAIGWGIQIMQFCIIQFSPASSYSLLCPNVLLITLCLKTLCLCPSCSVRDQVSQPCKTCILNFVFS
jgi:hypothetical protein